VDADYVIVGAGSAGCVLAARLSEDADTRVILIEAGGRDWHPLIHIPAGYLKMMKNPRMTWGYNADGGPELNGRQISYARGRVIGGSGAINGLVYTRSQPEDYDHWSQLGNRGWSWEDVLPHFRKSERWDGAENDVHSTQGPMATTHNPDRPELCYAAIEAGRQLGWEFRDDINNWHHGLGDHLGWVQQTRAGRLRASTARSHLHPAKNRPNLRIVTRAQVQRVLFDGTRAIGVVISRPGGGTENIRANAEVILAAGAIGSPHLLQLSGVGDPEHLHRIGVEVHHALPGVGRNLQDHLAIRVQAAVKDVGTLNERSRGLRFAAELFKYFAQGRGMLTFAASLVTASVKTLPESDRPDIHLLFAPASYGAGLIRKLDTKPGMTAGLWQMRPESRGFVEARSSDPNEHPAINPNYLAEDRDRRTVIAGLRIVRDWFNTPALKRYFVTEELPGPDVRTDDELLDYVRRSGASAYHPSGSCRMGQDAMAVVDERLRVRGLQGLRVIDAAIMPTVTSTNTNAPVVMIAEKGAAMVREDARRTRTAAA
jgi:choline dehydrogenase